MTSDANGNTSEGTDALASKTSAEENTANGDGALFHEETGSYNTADGYESMYLSTATFNNVADGAYTLYNNTGDADTAVGEQALYANTTGTENTGVGYQSLLEVTTGNSNTALGSGALEYLATGSSNTALGYAAGGAYTSSESNNIDIGSDGTVGENETIHIGNGQSATYIAGIFGESASGGSEVFVNSEGKLGTVNSSARFKMDIANLHFDLQKLLELRPVTFHYKTDPNGPVQYGLIAEEVNKLFPDLVVHDGQGNIQSVRYDELSSILLKEVQTQQAAMGDQQKQLDEQAQKLDAQDQQLKELNEKVAAMQKVNQELAAAVERVVNNSAPSSAPITPTTP